MYFYCVLEGEKATWYSGTLSFPITKEDIIVMYEESFKRRFEDSYKIMRIEDVNISNQIMSKKGYYNEIDGWRFEEPPQADVEVEYNVKEELFKTQTLLLQAEMDNQDLGNQLFNLQTELMMKGVL